MANRPRTGPAEDAPTPAISAPAGRVRERLDRALVARGLVTTRSRARDLVQRGLVTVRGREEKRPGALVVAEDTLTVASEGGGVSRGGAKLMGALEAFALSPDGRACLDIGASTGGFTEVLLAQGARRVLAVDVGHGQLHPSLAADPRVLSRERTDARSLTPAAVERELGSLADAIVVDLSFISVLQVLPSVLTLTVPGTWLVVLVKPQFEAGRDAVGKGGIVRDPVARRTAVERVEAWLATREDWQVIGSVPSPIPGGDGNEETLIGAFRHD